MGIAVAAGTGFINTGGCLVAVIGGSVLEIMLVRWIVQGILGALWWYFKTPPQNTHFYGDRGRRSNYFYRSSFDCVGSSFLAQGTSVKSVSWHFYPHYSRHHLCVSTGVHISRSGWRRTSLHRGTHIPNYYGHF